MGPLGEADGDVLRRSFLGLLILDDSQLRVLNDIGCGAHTLASHTQLGLAWLTEIVFQPHQLKQEQKPNEVLVWLKSPGGRSNCFCLTRLGGPPAMMGNFFPCGLKYHFSGFPTTGHPLLIKNLVDQTPYMHCRMRALGQERRYRRGRGLISDAAGKETATKMREGWAGLSVAIWAARLSF